MNTSDIVFTLQEENEESQTTTHSSSQIESGAHWEQSLAQLRQRAHQQKQNEYATTHESFNQITTPTHSHTLNKAASVQSSTIQHFGDQELDQAYQEYLKHREQQHNALAQNDNDIGVLIQEDWLAAQTALQSEHNRRHITSRQTLVFHQENQTVQEVSSESHEPMSNLPDYAVYVYDLPDLPITRKIKILSEQELMSAISERLKPHLSSVISGMVRQALQKKLANLSYDLQMELVAETPQIVQEVLEHNLSTILRVCKEKL